MNMFPLKNKYDAVNNYSQFGALTPLADGILGHSIVEGDCITIPFFVSTQQGKGYAGRFIDELKEKYKVIMFPNMISYKLEQMLLRRGFKNKHRYFPFLKGHCDVMYWKKP